MRTMRTNGVEPRQQIRLKYLKGAKAPLSSLALSAANCCRLHRPTRFHGLACARRSPPNPALSISVSCSRWKSPPRRSVVASNSRRGRPPRATDSASRQRSMQPLSRKTTECPGITGQVHTLGLLCLTDPDTCGTGDNAELQGRQTAQNQASSCLESTVPHTAWMCRICRSMLPR